MIKRRSLLQHTSKTSYNRVLTRMKKSLKEFEESIEEFDALLYPNKKKKISINDARFSVRTHNCLQISRVKYVNDLQNYTIAELSSIHGLGPGCLREIKIILDDYGMNLKQETRND